MRYIFLCLVPICLLSCIEALLPKPVDRIEYLGVDKESQLEFLRRMEVTPVVAFGDGCKTAYLILTGKIPEMPFEELKDALIKEGVIHQSWQYPPDKILLRGEFAYMLCKVLNLPGGLTMHVFGSSERYALNECIYRGLLLRGKPNEGLSGKEIIGTIQRAEELKQLKSQK